jgi:hypothetical protein
LAYIVIIVVIMASMGSSNGQETSQDQTFNDGRKHVFMFVYEEKDK